jgi:hypothetical protein
MEINVKPNKNLTTMKRYIIIACVLLGAVACKKDYPVDDDGLLVTTRQECYVSNFELLGTDHISVLSKAVLIDTTGQTISATVQFGTDLKNVYPQFTLAQDCKLDPKITGKTDLSDLANPKEYTVVSGDRQIRKNYKVLITVQPR